MWHPPKLHRNSSQVTKSMMDLSPTTICKRLTATPNHHRLAGSAVIAGVLVWVIGCLFSISAHGQTKSNADDYLGTENFRSTTQATSDSAPALCAVDSKQDIERLLDELNSSKYSIRQAAMSQLAQLGPEAIEPLAYALFEGTPEASWRIRQTMEELAFSNSIATMYQVGAVLKLRFNDINLENLKRKWQIGKRLNSIRHLRDQGIRVVDLKGLAGGIAMADAWRGRMRVQFAAPVEVVEDEVDLARVIAELKLRQGPKKFGGRVGGDMEELRPLEPGIKRNQGEERDQQQDDEERRQAELRREAELLRLAEMRRQQEQKKHFAQLSTREKIKHVLAADVATNQKFVEGDQFRPIQTGQPADWRSSGSGIELTFDRNWNGDVSKLDVLRGMSVVKAAFEEVELNAELLRMLTTFRMTDLTIRNCHFDEDQIATFDATEPSTLSPIATLSIDQVDDAEKFLQLVRRVGAEFESVRLLQGSASPQALDALLEFKKLQVLEVEKVSLDAATFDRLRALPELSSLTLKKCHFTTSDYHAFVERKKGLRVDFQAAAFLGVAGSRIETDAVEITRVVDGSAASDAGVKVGDVVTTFDGKEVKQFDDLRLYIAERNIGDTIKIMVIRDGQPVELSTKLKTNNEPFVR